MAGWKGRFFRCCSVAEESVGDMVSKGEGRAEVELGRCLGCCRRICSVAPDVGRSDTARLLAACTGADGCSSRWNVESDGAVYAAGGSSSGQKLARGAGGQVVTRRRGCWGMESA